MVNYLIAKDASTLKDKGLSPTKTAIEPITFECADSLSSGNDLTLTIPYRASDDLNPGDIVYVPDVRKTYSGTTKTFFVGGQLLSKEIDKKKGIVTYRGLSARGMLSNLLMARNYLTWNGYTSQYAASLYFYDPEGSQASYYTDGNNGEYIRYNIKKYMDALNEQWNFPVSFREDIYIPQSVFEEMYTHISSNRDYYEISFIAYGNNADGLSAHDIMSKYYDATRQKALILKGTDLLSVEFRPRDEHTYIITDEDVKYTTTVNTNVLYAHGGTYAYYNASGKATTATDAMPSTAMYQGAEMHSEYYGEMDSSGELRAALITKNAQSPVTMALDKIDPAKLDADTGDLIKFYDADMDLTLDSQIITEKLYKIQNGSASISYTIGGN